LTAEERRTLLALLHGAQDDDDGSDQAHTAALASLVKKVTRAAVSPAGEGKAT
jgi:hypothetical protein